MDLSLQLCEQLSSLPQLRRVIYYATNRASWWSRTFFGGRLANLVYTIKVEEAESLQELFNEDEGFWQMFGSGRTLGYESKIVPWLDFSTPGRATASLSLLAYIVDCLDKQSELSSDFILDAVCGPVCYKLKMLLSLQKLQGHLSGSSVDSTCHSAEETD
ncbi:E1B19K protein [Bovine adenovirus 2]|uniref:E1B protein, small T-antigen n=1 Tax=Bovine adenovirus 2 TaxID=114429 RepID=A0A9W4FTB0_ADEB2|nr:E1B19K protein [Bovine adenovirus 2]